MDVYTPSLVPQYARRPNCWTRLQIGVPKEEIGKICMVKDIALGLGCDKRIITHTSTSGKGGTVIILEHSRKLGKHVDVGKPADHGGHWMDSIGNS